MARMLVDSPDILIGIQTKYEPGNFLTHCFHVKLDICVGI